MRRSKASSRSSRGGKKRKIDHDRGWWVKPGHIIFGSLLIVFGLTVGKLSWDWWHSEWQEEEPYRIFVYARKDDIDRHYLIQISSMEGKINLVEINDEVLLKAGDYGEQSLEAIGRLVEIEGKSKNDLAEILTQALGRKIRKVIWIDQQETSEANLAAVGRQILIPGFFSGTNLYDGGRLFLVLSWQRGHRIATQVLDDYPVFDERQDVDGKIVRSINQLMFDRVLEDNLGLKVPVRSNWSVVVENMTAESGLAGRWARILRNDGFDVIGEASGANEAVEGWIGVENESIFKSMEMASLVRLLPKMPVRVEETLANYRSEVVVHLGKDLID